MMVQIEIKGSKGIFIFIINSKLEKAESEEKFYLYKPDKELLQKAKKVKIKANTEYQTFPRLIV